MVFNNSRDSKNSKYNKTYTKATHYRYYIQHSYILQHYFAASIACAMSILLFLIAILKGV